MLDEFKNELIDAVRVTVEKDMLTDEEAKQILDVCKQAVNRCIADVEEQFLMRRIAGEDIEESQE